MRLPKKEEAGMPDWVLAQKANFYWRGDNTFTQGHALLANLYMAYAGMELTHDFNTNQEEPSKVRYEILRSRDAFGFNMMWHVF